MSEKLVSNQLDYSKKILSYARYKMSKKNPQGNPSVHLSATGGEETVIQVPTEAINFSRSRLRMRVKLPESNTANRYVFAYTNTLPMIRSIQFYGDNFYNLVDIQNADVYLNVVRPVDTKIDDYLTFDHVSASATSADIETTNMGLCKNGVNEDSITNPLVAAGVQVPANFVVVNRHKRPNNSECNPRLTDMEYFIAGAEQDGAGAGNIWYDVDVPLSCFKNTLFSLDKDIYFPQIMNIRIIWNQYTKLAWIGSSLTNPTTNAAAYNPSLAANFIPTISNISIYFAIEQNPMIKQQLISQVKDSGLNVMIPYVHSLKKPVDGTSQTVSYTFRPSHGFMLKKIYHTLFPNAETLNNAFNHINTNAAQKVLQYYTLLNGSVRLQDNNIVTAHSDDYSIHHEKIKGSVIQNINMYKFNWLHVDSFGPDKPLCEDEDDYNQGVITGLPLDQETIWDINCLETTNATHNHYTFAVTLRNLNINAVSYSLDNTKPLTLM